MFLGARAEAEKAKCKAELEKAEAEAAARRAKRERLQAEEAKKAWELKKQIDAEQLFLKKRGVSSAKKAGLVAVRLFCPPPPPKRARTVCCTAVLSSLPAGLNRAVKSYAVSRLQPLGRTSSRRTTAGAGWWSSSPL